jgi:lysozyme
LWTIGFGHTLGVKEGQTCSREQANEFLIEDLKTAKWFVFNHVKSAITDNQFSALVSFAFNCGIGNLQTSTLLKKVNVNPADQTIKDEFLKWNKGGGKILNGLTRRRQAEAELYFKK